MTEKAKKISFIIIFSLLIIFFVSFMLLTNNSSKIKEIEEFIKTDTKVLNLSSNVKDAYINKMLKKYDVDFLEVDISKLSVFENRKIKRKLDIEDLENTIIVYQNGKVICLLKNYETEKQVQKFFQENNIIPKKIIDNVSEIKNQVNNILEEQYAMIYIPYVEHEKLKEQEQTLESIASKYSIEYKKIDAYYLSRKQQEKINAFLEISLVEDQILLLVKENKIVANIRGIHSKNTYKENLYELNFINELEDKINKIDYDEYKELLKDNDRNILFIGSSDIKDSDSIYDTLNKLSYNFDININYLEVDKENTYLYNKVKEKIENIGYENAFSLPIVLIIESNNILDYIIGNSTEEYFLDIFIENGVIKGDVINE